MGCPAGEFYWHMSIVHMNMCISCDVICKQTGVHWNKQVVQHVACASARDTFVCLDFFPKIIELCKSVIGFVSQLFPNGNLLISTQLQQCWCAGKHILCSYRFWNISLLTTLGTGFSSLRNSHWQA